jgi:cell surface protein SprA
LPKNAAIQLPVYASVNRTSSTPEYDPYDQDVKLNQKLDAATSKFETDSIKNVSEGHYDDQNFYGIKCKKNRTGNKKPKPWDISNLGFNYAYINMEHHNPLIEKEELRRTRAAIDYTYAPQVKPVEPFKQLIKSKSPWFALIRDFNFNYLPSLFSFKADISRQFGSFLST